MIRHVLGDLRERLGMSYLFVSHDLNLVRLLTDRVLVMYLGKIAESGPSEMVFEQPEHPYTRALLSAVPALEPGGRRHLQRLTGEPQSPIDPSPDACRFHGRCPDGVDRCAREMPVLRHAPGGERQAACHFAFAEDTAGRPAGD